MWSMRLGKQSLGSGCTSEEALPSSVLLFLLDTAYKPGCIPAPTSSLGLPGPSQQTKRLYRLQVPAVPCLEQVVGVMVLSGCC